MPDYNTDNSYVYKQVTEVYGQKLCIKLNIDRV